MAGPVGIGAFLEIAAGAASAYPKVQKVLTGLQATIIPVPTNESLEESPSEEVKIALLSDPLNFDSAINNIKDRCKKFFRRENGRDPMVIPIIIPTDN